MKPAPVSDLLPIDSALIGALVHYGVGLFGQRHLSPAPPLFQELTESYRDALGLHRRSWPELVNELSRRGQPLPPLRRLVDDFGLRPDELFLLGLCGELENSQPLLLALGELQSGDQPRPTLHLLAALLADLFHRPVTPAELSRHPLLRRQLLQIEGDEPLPMRTLRCAPDLWQVLGGHRVGWAQVSALAKSDSHAPITASSGKLAGIARLLHSGEAQALLLRGPVEQAAQQVVHLAGRLGLQAVRIDTRRWQDDPALHWACRYAGWLPLLSLQLNSGERFVPSTVCTLPVVYCASRDGMVETPGLIELNLQRPDRATRQRLWQQALGHDAASTLAGSAVLDEGRISALGNAARLEALRRGEPVGVQHVASVRARLGGSRLHQLAQPVARQVAPDALVLPPPVERQFRHLSQRCQRRDDIWQGLGNALAGTPDSGVRALFSGPSGTGKTLAASRLATILGAPLFRLDLAAVMNKYVGETEKNLGLLLDEAAQHDVILLMDEADALFGQRSDGGNNGERYANLLTNFLLTRIEAHPGIVLLTSNARGRIDGAFTRRLDFIIEFTEPGVAERLAIWQAHLGQRSPGDDGLKLLAAYSELPGGHIRNAVINAAAQTVGNQPIALPALLDALRDEYRKLNRNPPDKLNQLEQQSCRK